MSFALVEIERLEKLLEEIADLKRSITALSQQGKLPGGENEWEYVTLDEALELLKITKKSWYKSYKNTTPKVIPYTKYGDRIWIKKSDLKKFLEKRRLS